MSTKYLAITHVPHYSRRFLNFQLRYLLKDVHNIPTKKVPNVSCTATICLSLKFNLTSSEKGLIFLD